MAQLFLLILLIIFAVTGIKLASENQRFAIYRLGRFFGLKGPGLLLIIPWIDRSVKISIGDRGELLPQDFAKIKGVDIPVKVEGSATIGNIVRVQSFTEKYAAVVVDSVQMREVVCEKCGHINRL